MTDPHQTEALAENGSRPSRVPRHGSVARSLTWTGLDPVIIGIVAFFVVHMAIRLFGTSNFGVDETETAAHTQVFALFYKVNNPPLFDWAFYAVSQVLGPSLLAMEATKTLFLAGGGVFLYLGARPAFRHRIALDAAIVSYGATAIYGWDIFQQFSHTNALVFAVGFTFWALMRVLRSARLIDYVVLGAALGIGLLSKYLFLLTFVTLLLAALRLPAYRPAILSWRLAIALAVGLIVVSPLLIGYLDVAGEVSSALTNRVAGSGSGRRVTALAYLVVLTAEFWLPFAVILWVSLVRWPAGKSDSGGSAVDVTGAEGDDGFYPLVRDATILAFVALVASMLFFGTGVANGRYLIPILSFLPLATLAAIDRRDPFPSLAISNFWRAAMAVIVGMAVIRFLLFLFTSPPFCVPRCVLFVDHSPTAERLVAAAGGKQNVILSNHVHIGSNLRRLIPEAKIVMHNYTGHLDLGIADPDQRVCHIVWFRKYRNSEEVDLESALQRAIGRPPTESELATVGRIEYYTADWQTPVLWDWGPDTTMAIAEIDSASPLCDNG